MSKSGYAKDNAEKVRPAIEEKVRKSVASMRDKLLYIAASANAALYTDGDEADARDVYEEALADIRKTLDDGTFYTPPEVFAPASGALPQLTVPKHVKTSVKLPGLFGIRVQGVLNGNGERREFGAFVRTQSEGNEYFEIYRDHMLLANGFVKGWHSLGVKLVSRMLKRLVMASEHAIRRRANRKKRAEESAASIEREGGAE